MKVDSTQKLFADMDKEIQATLDGDQRCIDVQALAGEYVIEDDHDDVLEPMFGDFLPDIDEVMCTDSYHEYVGAQMTFDLGGESGLQGTVVKRAKGENGTPIGEQPNTQHMQIYCSADGQIRTGICCQPNCGELVFPGQ
jgi:hypothetical protein